MTTTELPIPADLMVDAPPLTDEDLERLGAWAHETGNDIGANVAVVAREAIGWEGAELPERVTRWTIDGPNTAAWAGAKLADYLAERRRIEEQAEEWIDRIRHWAQVELASRRIDSSIAFFEAHLEHYALRERLAGGPKTLRLPTVKVSTRSTSPKVVVVDEDLALEWAKANELHEIVNVKTSLSVSGLRNVVEIVEVVDIANVALAPCGCLAEWRNGQSSWPLPGLADGITCPSCEEDALTADVRVVTSHLAAVGPDGEPVPGVVVEAEIVNAKVEVTS